MSVEARGPLPTWRRGRGPTRAMGWGRRLAAPLRLSFGLRERVGKIGTWHLVSSNSEDICRTAFLKSKTAENRNWHCGILLIG